MLALLALCGRGGWRAAATSGDRLRQQSQPKERCCSAPSPRRLRRANQVSDIGLLQRPPVYRQCRCSPPIIASREAWKCLTDGMAEKNYDRRAQTVAALGTIGLRRDAGSR